MKESENIIEISRLPIDMLGFIFYPLSPRYIENLSSDPLSFIPPAIGKVGVFVNQKEEDILFGVNKYQLQMVQLHGEESPLLCEKLKNRGLKVIKVFNVLVEEDLERISEYESICDYFLFDTKTDKFGGSGKKFDWTVLQYYTGKTPFILSGGIGPGDINGLLSFKHDFFWGIDLNSRFEIDCGIKDPVLLQQFIKEFNR